MGGGWSKYRSDSGDKDKVETGGKKWTNKYTEVYVPRGFYFSSVRFFVEFFPARFDFFLVPIISSWALKNDVTKVVSASGWKKSKEVQILRQWRKDRILKYL